MWLVPPRSWTQLPVTSQAALGGHKMYTLLRFCATTDSVLQLGSGLHQHSREGTINSRMYTNSYDSINIPTHRQYRAEDLQPRQHHAHARTCYWLQSAWSHGQQGLGVAVRVCTVIHGLAASAGPHGPWWMPAAVVPHLDSNRSNALMAKLTITFCIAYTAHHSAPVLIHSLPTSCSMD